MRHRFRTGRATGGAYSAARNLLRLDVAEQARLVVHLVRWIVLGAVVGGLAGLASAGFLETLTWATDTREAHRWLLFGLPIAGFVVGLAYHYGGGRAVEGNNLIIDEIHDPKAWVPRRMAPLVFAGTVLTHLFGGSAGREGTALQMSGSLTDGFARAARLGRVDRRLLLIAALAGGFGSVFGVPLTGCVFALEVQAVGRIRYDAIVPAFTASLIGDQVVRGLGVHHTPVPTIGPVDLSAPLLLKVLLAGLLFGLTALVFAELTHGVKAVFRSTVRWAPARPLIGGVLVIGLTYAVGTRDYLGLSLPLISESLAAGGTVVAGAFALKLLFTALTLGSGFQGGEVTPLFVIGATLGAALGHLLGVPGPLLAAVGFVAVFAGATNTPLACTLMGVELFGAGPIVLLAVACITSYVVVGDRGIYSSQRIDTAKTIGRDHGPGPVTLHTIATQRRPWLPARSSPTTLDDEPTG
jgi:H+/Cl- antiporter ClcA